jgi:DNA-binding transcriptional regulator of glucitol operon
VRRFVFTPRWVLGHALVVAAAVCCVLLGRWQLGRAEITHSMQNMAYALQWPLFAVFFVLMWVQMLRLESRRLDEEADAEQPGEPETALPGGEPVPPGRTSPGQPVPAVAHPAESAVVHDEDDDPELAAYNRMLAELAARDRESTRRR